jgi:hypothetical protein
MNGAPAGSGQSWRRFNRLRAGAIGVGLVGFSAAFLASSLRELDAYVQGYGWGYISVPLPLVLPVVGAGFGLLLVLAALRDWRFHWSSIAITVWFLLTVADFVFLPLRE